MPYGTRIGVPLPAPAVGSQLHIRPLVPHDDPHPLTPGVHDIRPHRRLHRNTGASRRAVSTEHRPNSTSGQGASRARLTGSSPSDGRLIPAVRSASRNSFTVSSADSTQYAECCDSTDPTVLPFISEFHSSRLQSALRDLHSAGVCALQVPVSGRWLAVANGSRQAVWEFFGTELKRRREDAGITQVELGLRVFVSGGYIGQFEQAIRKPQLDVAQRIDEALQTDGIFERLWRKLIKEQRYADYFAHAAELERLATSICEWAPAVVPGLLQTPEYARAIYLASNPLVTDAYVQEMVSLRMERAQLLKDATRPLHWVILHEAVLRVPVGSPAVMAQQLEHIAELTQSRKLLVQVLPFSAGAHPQMGKLMTLMEFEDAPPATYTEGVLSGSLLDDPAVVKRTQADYDLLRVAAVSLEASLTLIESAAEGYRRCAGTT